MRRSVTRVSVLALVAGLAALPAAAEATKSLRYAFDAGESFLVENLAGRMTVVPGGRRTVEIVATVHAKDGTTAEMLSIEEVPGTAGRHVRVAYPLDDHVRYRYPGSGNTTTRYAGRRVKVSRSTGLLLYADLEIRVPADVEGKFRNAVGDIQGQGLSGRLTFDTGSGEVSLAGVRGEVSVDTGSGRIEASDIEGSFNGDTGSGSIVLTRFRGREIRCDTGSGGIKIGDSEAEEVRADTGSGGIHVSATRARRVNADTGSGDISFSGDGLEEFEADTGSGDVEIETRSLALARVNVDTGSGSLEVRIPSGLTFEAIADQDSGSLRSRFPDAEPIIEGREVVGYRRGDGRARIRFSTGSGSLLLEPI